MKNEAELKELKERYEKINKQLQELSDEELAEVTGAVLDNKFEFTPI